MKTRKFEKKLNLNKETVVALNEMISVKGGAFEQVNILITKVAVTCDTYCYCSDYVTVCGSQPCC